MVDLKLEGKDVTKNDRGPKTRQVREQLSEEVRCR